MEVGERARLDVPNPSSVMVDCRSFWRRGGSTHAERHGAATLVISSANSRADTTLPHTQTSTTLHSRAAPLCRPHDYNDASNTSNVSNNRSTSNTSNNTSNTATQATPAQGIIGATGVVGNTGWGSYPVPIGKLLDGFLGDAPIAFEKRVLAGTESL